MLGSSRSRLWTGHDLRTWPVLLLLLVVLVPTVGVLWFMSQAMRNERLAVRQKLSDVYEAQLLGLQQELQLFWHSRTAQLEVHDSNATGSRVFAERVRGGLADSIVVYDPDGQLAYPAPPRPPQDIPSEPGGWRRAELLERAGQSAEAAGLYAAVAERATDVTWAARALQAQARCLALAGQAQDALRILAEELGRPRYADAVDSEGRQIVPSAQLRALQLIEDESDPTSQRIAEALADRLSDYDSMLPASQRRFLSRQLRALIPELPALDTQAAEQLARRYLESDPSTPSMAAIQPSGLPAIWHLAVSDGAIVALFDQQKLVADLEFVIVRGWLPESSTVELLPPGVKPDDDVLVSLPAGGFLAGWQLALKPEDPSLFQAAANQRISAYLLTGFLVVGLILVLALLVARAVSRQLRLTRLKNDLLSTVSHELKTPLASIRVLVDTLLESETVKNGQSQTASSDSRRLREYLELIAKENVRLSRLVDNFLTFSRMEQNRQSLDKRPIPAANVIETAADSVADRFQTGCRFDVEISSDLPEVMADPDALVTVLLNLLDNAYKYSNEEKHIVLRGYRDNGHACFAVRDNGLGLSARESAKIFDRFYQVDQSLSRPGSGVGLGLAIVRFIVQAHDGSVDVESRPGEGSTFTVRLPAELNSREDSDG